MPRWGSTQSIASLASLLRSALSNRFPDEAPLTENLVRLGGNGLDVLRAAVDAQRGSGVKGRRQGRWNKWLTLPLA